MSNRLQKMPSSSPVNLNHLLNFSLPPRESRPATNLPRRSRKPGSSQGVWNKERFVNAQYRFVMNPNGDYTVHFADPDIFFQWHDILQVIVPRSSALAAAAVSGEISSQEEGYTTCPICLSPPTAPRMTKCGHVFCFPCILHYLSTSLNKWARCPICFDSVNERQLKCVKWYDGPSSLDANSDVAESPSTLLDSGFETVPRTGSYLKMRLIQRPQITTLALPRSHTWPSDLIPPHQAPFHFLPDIFNFAKFMLATPSYLVSDLTRDLDELEMERRTLSSMNDPLGVMFIDGAENKVREQIAKATALDTLDSREAIGKCKREQADIEERHARQLAHRIAAETNRASQPPSDIPHELLAARMGGVSIDGGTTNPEASPSRPPSQSRNTPRQRRNLNPPPPSTSTYYYYQAASGLPIYLHPLDIKILLSHFNNYSAFPDSITVRVESVAEGTVNDDLRKRCKYLAHLPEGTDVVFIESDLSDVVGTERLKNFEGPLRMRTSRRKEKARKDDRAKARSEEKERERVQSTMAWMPASSSTAGAAASSQPVVYVEEPREDFAALGTPRSSTLPETAPLGAWGVRSFASALHSPSTQRRPQSQTHNHTIADEYDLDIAWHELEQRTGGGGGGSRRKRANKLVVLGSGGGGARRR